jgi:hypothetical protein
MFFELGTAPLGLLLILIIGGSSAVGVAIGRRLRAHQHEGHESVGVVQGTLLGLVGLLLAFGLTMAVNRYEGRRALVVEEANAIETTYLRAELLAEPSRSRSLELLERYADAAIALAEQVPGTDPFDANAVRMNGLQRQLWGEAGDAVRDAPQATAPRLYLESLNDMIDTHTARVGSLKNRVPGTVMLLQVVGSAVALGVLSLYLALLGRGLTTALVSAALVFLILYVSFDLDRPHRGLITVPDSALEQARASMELPPAAEGP